VFEIFYTVVINLLLVWFGYWLGIRFAKDTADSDIDDLIWALSERGHLDLAGYSAAYQIQEQIRQGNSPQRMW
jgi:hypothetical protein